MRKPTNPLFAFLLMVPACSSNESVPSDADTREASALVGSTVRLTCSTLRVTKGRIGSGQSAATLATNDLSGSTDTWTKYVEFWPGTSATCEFKVPTLPVGETLAGLTLQVNYRGPTSSTMLWTFEALNKTTGAWEPIGNNAPANSWVWSAFTSPVSGSVDRFIDNGVIRVRYSTTKVNDASQLDQWILTAVTASSGTPPSRDAGTDSSSPLDAGTDASPPPPPDATSLSLPAPVWNQAYQENYAADSVSEITSGASKAYVLVDPFNSTEARSAIPTMKSKGNVVGCYISSGTCENWRDGLAPVLWTLTVN